MFVNVRQNTEEWFQLRLGKITSSNFDKIMANEGKAFGPPAIEYAEKVALEVVTGERDESSSFKNGYMERGNDLEPVAKELYEIERFCEVSNGGFNISDCEKFGDSPDGNVGKNGCIEIKSVIPKTQWKRIKKGGVDMAYKWQIQGHLLLGKKEWCDFVSYCPEMPENKRLHIERVYPDEDMIERLKQRLTLFHEEVLNNIELLK